MSGVPLFSFVSYVFYFFMKQLYGHRMQGLKVKDEKVKHRSSLFKVRWRNGCKTNLVYSAQELVWLARHKWGKIGPSRGAVPGRAPCP